jgi:lysophospholipid acyltransferase (LPLAT)-like uncharacterized protein
LKKLLRDTLRSSWFQRAVGFLAAEWLRLVFMTNRFSFEPGGKDGLYARVEAQMPAIFAFWHGQHFLTPFIKNKPSQKAKVLISLHRDGEFNAIAAERLGIGTIRGSGDHAHRYQQKGGVVAFKGMLELLAEGWNMALTADVPKVARVAGRGIVTLARESGRPIFPISFATSRRIVLDNWDRSEVNLPFSRGAIVAGEPIRIAKDADAPMLEQARATLEKTLNAVTERAHAVVDRQS